ncbi:MAG: hypothetical protein ABL982_10900 [Vicinamibacterales bacterium]
MTDALFVLALVVPPVVVVTCFALLVLPARREPGAVHRVGASAH